MTMMTVIFISIISTIACTSANFVYQALNTKNWRMAIERSWFQATMAAIIVLNAYIYLTLIK